MSGFLIAPRCILEELGPREALLYGRVWLYCQARRGECWASVETLARESFMGRRTASRALAALVEHGYLECTTREGSSTIYAITDKYVHGGDPSQNGAEGNEDETTQAKMARVPKPKWQGGHAKMAGGACQNGALIEEKEDDTKKNQQAAPAGEFSKRVEGSILKTTGMPTRRENGSRYAWAGRMIAILGANTDDDADASIAALSAWWAQRDRFSKKSENDWPADLAEFFRDYNGNGPDGNAVMDF